MPKTLYSFLPATDRLLTAFGDGEHLDKEAVLEIFDGNENLAVTHINILSQLKYIRKIGEVEGSRLGLVFYKEEGADLFLVQGGFTSKFLKASEEQKAQNDRQLLQDENLKLENEALRYQATIRNQEDRIRDLEEKVKRFEMIKNYEWLIRLCIGVFIMLGTWLVTK